MSDFLPAPDRDLPGDRYSTPLLPESVYELARRAGLTSATAVLDGARTAFEAAASASTQPASTQPAGTQPAGTADAGESQDAESLSRSAAAKAAKDRQQRLTAYLLGTLLELASLELLLRATALVPQQCAGPVTLMPCDLLKALAAAGPPNAAAFLSASAAQAWHAAAIAALAKPAAVGAAASQAADENSPEEEEDGEEDAAPTKWKEATAAARAAGGAMAQRIADALPPAPEKEAQAKRVRHGLVPPQFDEDEQMRALKRSMVETKIGRGKLKKQLLHDELDKAAADYTTGFDIDELVQVYIMAHNLPTPVRPLAGAERRAARRLRGADDSQAVGEEV